MSLRIGVVTFPGSADDRDALRALRLIDAEAVPLWHASDDLQGVAAVILPGGASYGDYVRPGAIARFAPIMAALTSAASNGLPVLGIGNGFQILCEAHLLPGVLTRNASQRFHCRDERLRVESNATAWTRDFEVGESITLPLKAGFANFFATPDTLAELEATGRVVLRYESENPVGSAHSIAGLANAAGNVVGLMPHPEHALETGYGPGGELGPRTGTDGVRFFTSITGALLGSR